jgi:hypothetical protein
MLLWLLASGPTPLLHAEASQPLEELEWEELPVPEDELEGEEGFDLEETGPTPSEDAPVAPAEEGLEASSHADDEDDVNLQPPSPRHSGRAARPDRRTPKFPQTWFSVSILAGPRNVGAGLGATYFVIPAIGLGLEIDNIVHWHDDGGFNLFRLTPVVWALLLPRFNTTPFVRTGFGGEFFSHRLGAYGRWLAGGGVLFRFRSRWMVELGIDVVGRVPDLRFQGNFECQLTDNPCSLGLEPRIGAAIGF